MTETQSAFQELLQTTGKYPEALPQVPLHGFLTAVALGPDMAEEDRILATVYGCPVNESSDDFITLEQLVWDVVEEFIDDLDAQPFEPLLQLEAGHPTNPALWVEGFNKAVMLDEPAWSALNDEHLSAGKLYAFIQSLASPDLAETLFGIPVSEYDAYLAESIPMLPNALETLFRAYLEEGPDYPLDDPDGNYALNEDDLPRFSPEQLQQQTDEQLLGKILILGDMLPREVVDEAIRRGPPMARLLRRHLEDPANWHEDADLGAWWGLLHAVFILGHVTGEDAVKGLLHTVGQIRSDDDSALWEWLGGYLPVLFSNKREQAREGLRQIAFNKELDWKTRITALECLLEGAHAAGQQALDELLGEAARMAADEQEDWDIRLTTALHLLNFPRDAHRAVLEQLAQEQLEKERFLYYSLEDVQKAYRNGKDVPEWERFTAPLSFYDPQTILERQHRWLKKDQEQKDSDWLEDNDWLEEVDDLPYLLDDEMDTPYVRETAKVGRNEPCPCGSGKKYKKCCLNKLH